MRSFIHQFDRAADQWVGRLPRRVSPLLRTASMLGHPVVVYIIAAGLLYTGLAYADQMLQLAACIIAATHVTSSLLKLTFGRRRPAAYSPRWWTVKTHSFPSGHAAGSSVAYGTLVLVVSHLQIPFAIILVPLVLAWVAIIGVSRIYLGAHYASDVVAGWVLGAVGIMLIYQV